MILTVIMLFAATAMSTVAASGAVVKCCEADLPLVYTMGPHGHTRRRLDGKVAYWHDDFREMTMRTIW